jgi:hypothetical protein
LELPHLHNLATTAARSRMGRVMAAWSIIEANLAAGKSLREVWEAAELDELAVPYAVFKTYVQRLRRRGLRTRPNQVSIQPAVRAVSASKPPQTLRVTQSDPFRNLREQRAKTTGFNYDPFPRKGLTR